MPSCHMLESASRRELLPACLLVGFPQTYGKPLWGRNARQDRRALGSYGGRSRACRAEGTTAAWFKVLDEVLRW